MVDRGGVQSMPIPADWAPVCRLVGLSADTDELANLLTVALGVSVQIGHFARVSHSASSSQIFAPEEISDIRVVESHPEELRGHKEVAEYLMGLAEDGAKYHPPDPPTPLSRKGWEVRAGNYYGQTFVLVIAVWVP